MKGPFWRIKFDNSFHEPISQHSVAWISSKSMIPNFGTLVVVIFFLVRSARTRTFPPQTFRVKREFYWRSFAVAKKSLPTDKDWSCRCQTNAASYATVSNFVNFASLGASVTSKQSVANATTIQQQLVDGGGGVAYVASRTPKSKYENEYWDEAAYFSRVRESQCLDMTNFDLTLIKFKLSPK